MQLLTHREQETLSFVTQYADKHGYAPVMREIVKGTRHKSTSTVQKDLDILVKKGYVRRSRGTSRGLVIKKQPATCDHKRITSIYAGAVGAALQGFICQRCAQFWSLDHVLECLRSGLCQPSKKEPDSPLSSGLGSC